MEKFYNLRASTGPGVFVVVCVFYVRGAPEDSTGSSSGFKTSQRGGLNSHPPAIEQGTIGYKASPTLAPWNRGFISN